MVGQNIVIFILVLVVLSAIGACFALVYGYRAIPRPIAIHYSSTPINASCRLLCGVVVGAGIEPGELGFEVPDGSYRVVGVGGNVNRVWFCLEICNASYIIVSGKVGPEATGFIYVLRVR